MRTRLLLHSKWLTCNSWYVQYNVMMQKDKIDLNLKAEKLWALFHTNTICSSTLFPPPSSFCCNLSQASPASTWVPICFANSGLQASDDRKNESALIAVAVESADAESCPSQCPWVTRSLKSKSRAFWLANCSLDLKETGLAWSIEIVVADL